MLIRFKMANDVDVVVNTDNVEEFVESDVSGFVKVVYVSGRFILVKASMGVVALHTQARACG